MGVWKAPEKMWRTDQARTRNREARPEAVEVIGEGHVTLERGRLPFKGYLGSKGLDPLSNSMWVIKEKGTEDDFKRPFSSLCLSLSDIVKYICLPGLVTYCQCFQMN